MNAAVVELGVPADRVIAMPFGVDCSQFRLPDRPPPPAPPLRLICTRNFAPIYAVDSLVEAVAAARDRGLAIQVSLVGAGPLEAELRGQVQRLGLAEVVRFRGHVDHVTLARLLGEHHVFVTPARSDGNNVSLNEAMACGCFPIATDIPANTQWLQDGENGLLYPAGDARSLARCIERAAADAGWRARAALLNRRIVEARANWRASVERMKSIYARAIAREAAES
jgi:glycosyltransferase involved in cell wall biosynthesis